MFYLNEQQNPPLKGRRSTRPNKANRRPSHRSPSRWMTGVDQKPAEWKQRVQAVGANKTYVGGSWCPRNRRRSRHREKGQAGEDENGHIRATAGGSTAPDEGSKATAASSHERNRHTPSFIKKKGYVKSVITDMINIRKLKCKE